MTIKLTVEAETIKGLGEQLQEAANQFSQTGTIKLADYMTAQSTVKSNEVDPKHTAPTQETTSKDMVPTTGLIADDVLYSGKSTKRNAWLLLTDGRVIYVAAGGHLPDESVIEKRLTKTAFNELVANGTEQVTNIADSEEVKHIKPTNEVEEDEEDEDEEEEEDEEDEEEDEDEDEEDEEEEDEDETYTLDEVNKLVAHAKKIDGGKKAIKELLAEYDVKVASKLDDDDLQEFADEVVEFIEENE